MMSMVRLHDYSLEALASLQQFGADGMVALDSSLAWSLA